MLKLYENIKTRRKQLGMTQSELAQKVGYSDKSMISLIEAGRVDISRSKIMAFAEALHVSPGDLIGPAEDPPAASELEQLQKMVEARPELWPLLHAAEDMTAAEVARAVKVLEALKEARHE